MWVGGYMAESGASTACEGWPACNGSILPGANDQEITHMIHRYIAGAFLFFMIPFVIAAWRRRGTYPWTGYAAAIGGGLYAGQVLVGALNVWYAFPDPLTISHTVIASLIWFTLASVVIVDYYRPTARSAERQLSGREVPV
jgi:heme A synthase